jgi:hypothetical protein
MIFSGSFLLPGILLLLSVYFLPAILAWFRKTPHLMNIFLLNLLLGWTIVGWVIAFKRVFASHTSHNKRKSQDVWTFINDRTWSEQTHKTKF